MLKLLKTCRKTRGVKDWPRQLCLSYIKYRGFCRILRPRERRLTALRNRPVKIQKANFISKISRIIWKILSNKISVCPNQLSALSFGTMDCKKKETLSHLWNYFVKKTNHFYIKTLSKA